MITLDCFTDKRDGTPLAGFIIRNKKGTPLAIGAHGTFLVMTAPRYAHDLPLVRKCERLTGLAARNFPPRR